MYNTTYVLILVHLLLILYMYSVSTMYCSSFSLLCPNLVGSHRVIVSSTEDEENDRVYRCSASVTAGDILDRWTTELGLPPDAASLRRTSGSFYRPQEPLFRSGTTEKMAEVFAERVWRLRVTLGADETRDVNVSPGDTPRDLMETLRVAFGLSATRPMRLALGATALETDQALGAQGVRSGHASEVSAFRCKRRATVIWFH